MKKPNYETYCWYMGLRETLYITLDRKYAIIVKDIYSHKWVPMYHPSKLIKQLIDNTL